MKSVLAEIPEDAFLDEDIRPADLAAVKAEIDHMRGQIAAQCDMALLLVQACGLDLPKGR